MRIKNLLIGKILLLKDSFLLDFFTTNIEMKTLDVSKALTHIISFSTNED